MKKTQKKMNFEILELISENQKDISNWLLLYCAKKAAAKAQEEDKKRREKQFDDLRKSIMPEFSHSDNPLTLKHMAKHWLDDEMKWRKNYSNEYERTIIINSLSYRLLSIFFRNHIHCPFYKEGRKGGKPDEKDFQEENQKLFREFLNQSTQLIESQRKFHPIKGVFRKLLNFYYVFIESQGKFHPIKGMLPLLKEIQKINISESIYSAAYKLYGKDWDIAKGLFIGGVTGGVVSIFLGPVIGGYIGKLAGLSGAAATNYGLALLGGGSLAAGGLGMAGGSAVLGLGFGISNGVRQGIKNASIDELNVMQAQALLPVLLAIGRAQFENGDKAIPVLIHRIVSKRLKEFEQRFKKLENEHNEIFDSGDEKKIENLKKSVKESVKLYRRAEDMSLRYGWQSGYDIWKKRKPWAS